MPADLYKILEVVPAARPEVIHAAYRALAKIHARDPKMLAHLNSAKEILLDDEIKKADYDRSLKQEVKKIGNYRVVREIAKGGFGVTYEAEHVRLGTKACIKHASKRSPEDEVIILEEAKIIWDLRHWGIPSIRDIVPVPDGSLALVMSYVPGPTLFDLVEKHGRLDPEHVAWIAERMLNTLKYLHYNGVVHGDVKPKNTIIQPENHMVTLVDYGLSCLRPVRHQENKGHTPFFAAPEQENGTTVLPEADLYSLGMTMVYALGGDITLKKVPGGTPDPLCKFIKRLLPISVLSRPNWQKEDLCATIKEVRKESFGREFTNFKPLPT